MDSQHNSVSAAVSTAAMSQKLIRIERLQSLMDSRGHGSVREFADSLGKNYTQISDLLRGRIPFGERLARGIEQAAGLPTGWLDDVVTIETLDGNTAPELFNIPHVDVVTTDGVPGYALKTIDSPGQPVFFDRGWIEERGLRASSLRSMRIKDQSMFSRLNEGDMVVFSIDQTEPVERAVFLIKHEGEVVIRRMIRDEGTWQLLCDNPDKALYPTKKLGSEAIIIGQVVHKMSDFI